MAAAAELRGTVAIPEADHVIEPTELTELDNALTELSAQKHAWVGVGIRERIELLRSVADDLAAVAEAWIADALKAKGLAPGSGGEGEEWLAGPFTVMRNLRLLIRALQDIEQHGRPIPPGPTRQVAGGKIAVGVFPYEIWDRLFFMGFQAEVWMQEGVTPANLPEHQAGAYRAKARGETPQGKVALVLGAGNVSSIGPMDALYKLFVEDQVVLLKMNPVNEYLGPHIVSAFRALVDRGFMRVVYGGITEGAYLCSHGMVDEIHITGSDKTHDAIVYGVGAEGAAAKAARTPINTRRITSELGNVSPVIVVPGPWSASDLAFQGTNLASMLTNNAGFNCNATRLIVTHQGWGQRDALLDEVRSSLEQAPSRKSYYPGAKQRWDLFHAAHPEAEAFGASTEGALPWTLIPGLDSASPEDPCFTTEAFCGVFGEVPLDADSVVDYIQRAVAFCNDKVWGTLNAALIVHPSSLKDPKVAAAVEQAIADLRYGAVAVNHWPALAYGMVTTTWGAYPGHPDHDIQSGRGVVHNTFFFDKVEKTVVRGPFRVAPKPAWFVTNKNNAMLGRRLCAFEHKPSWLRVPGVSLQALKG